MKRIIVFFVFILLFKGYGFSDSWVEKPDIDFYAHPLIENKGNVKKVFTGKVIIQNNLKKVKVNGKTMDIGDENLYEYRAGDRVICEINGRVSILDYNRSFWIFFTAGLFVIGVLILNFKKGFLSVFSLFFGLFIFVFFFLNFTERGFSPLLTSGFSVVLITAITLFSISGKFKKGISAFLGAIGGIFFGVLFAYFFLKKGHVWGFAREQIQLLNYLIKNFSIPLKSVKGIVLSGILIGTAGVVMDVAISISSSLYEFFLENNKISSKKLFFYGMNIGRDIISTMANSLLFAYAGSSFFYVFAVSFQGYSLMQILNSEGFFFIFVEIFSGTSAIVVTVFLTVVFSSLIIPKRSYKIQNA